MLRFKPGWKMTLFVLCLSPLLLWLALWQLDREVEKAALQQEYDERTAAPPIPVAQIDWTRNDLGFLRISATGRYDNEQAWLLDNRIFQGRAGFEVLSPFVTDGGQVLVVNRGWISQGPTRQDLPPISPVNGTVTITGSIYVPEAEPFLLATTPPQESDWPRVIQSIDVDRMGTELGVPLLPWSVRLEAAAPGSAQPNWQPINMLPEKHRAYAVQWFAMLAALLGLYIYFGFRHPEPTRERE